MKNYFYSKRFLDLLERHEEFLDLIFSIEKLRSSFVVKPQEIAGIPNETNTLLHSIKKFRQQVNIIQNDILSIIRAVKPNKVYDLANEFMLDLNVFDHSYNDENSFIKEIKEFPDKHTDAYAERGTAQIFAITESSNLISKTINDLKEKSLFLISESNQNKYSIPSNYSSLTIGTDQDLPLIEDFCSVFNSLEELYKISCIIHKVDPKENNIIINQISTGSWYTNLFGIKQVVQSIENLLRDIGGFIRDVITGKIKREQFENECNKAEAFINLMALAKKNGIDNGELGVFKALSPLIDAFQQDTTVVDVNGEEILKLRKTEKLTLLKRKSERAKILEKINLSIEDKKTKKKN